MLGGLAALQTPLPPVGSSPPRHPVRSAQYVHVLHLRDRASDLSIERAITRASERASDRARERASDRASERLSKRAIDRSSDRVWFCRVLPCPALLDLVLLLSCRVLSCLDRSRLVCSHLVSSGPIMPWCVCVLSSLSYLTLSCCVCCALVLRGFIMFDFVLVL